MADEVEAFFKRAGIGNEFAGKAPSLLEASGATGLDDLVELVDELDDLRNLYDAGFKVLPVKKLFRAIVAEQKRRESGAAAAGAIAQAVSEAGPPAPLKLLEKTVSTVPEDTVKDPSEHVSVRSVRLHEKTTKRGAYAPRKKAVSGTQEQEAEEYPALGPAGPVSSTAKRAATERAARSAELARRHAETAQEAAAEAANAEVAQHVLSAGPSVMSSSEHDRTLEFFWSKTTFVLNKGKHELGAESPISQLSEEEFKKEFLAALKAICALWPSDGRQWELPKIENWIMYEPEPKSKKRFGGTWDPFVLLTFADIDDADGLRTIFKYHQENPGEVKFLKIKGQSLKMGRPSPKFVSRAASTQDSETTSQAPSMAGSDASHSSAITTGRNMTLLFRNIPEDLISNTTQRPSIKAAVEDYVRNVLATPPMPIRDEVVSVVTSFVTPKRAPPGGLWLTFSYLLQGKRVHSDGKAYTLLGFKEMYQKSGLPAKSDGQLEKMFWACSDAVRQAEQQLGTKERPTNIANFFMDRVKKVDEKKRRAAEEKKQQGKDLSLEERQQYLESRSSWTTCKVGGKNLSVAFKRPDSTQY